MRNGPRLGRTNVLWYISTLIFSETPIKYHHESAILSQVLSGSVLHPRGSLHWIQAMSQEVTQKTKNSQCQLDIDQKIMCLKNTKKCRLGANREWPLIMGHGPQNALTLWIKTPYLLIILFMMALHQVESLQWLKFAGNIKAGRLSLFHSDAVWVKLTFRSCLAKMLFFCVERLLK